jgi:hypothetical protein
LAKWLIENNEEFVNYYKDPPRIHTTINNRIEARMERIKDNMNTNKRNYKSVKGVDTSIPEFSEE